MSNLTVQQQETELLQLANQLRMGNDSLEARFGELFWTWGNSAVNGDPSRFLQTLTALDGLQFADARIAQRGAFLQAVATFKQGKPDAALKAFGLLIDDVGVESVLVARSLNGRAVCQRVLGQHEAALDDYRASLDVWRALGEPHFEALVLKNMGIVNYELRDYWRAQRNFEQATQIFTAIGEQDWVVTTGNDLGLVYLDLGRLDEARACFERVVEWYRREDIPEYVSSALSNIGEVLLFQGEFEAAEKALQEATVQADPYYLTDKYLFLGLARQAQGAFDEALAAYERALKVAAEIGRNEFLPATHFRLADLLRRQGLFEDAQQHLLDAIDIIESSRADLSDETIKIGLIGRWQQVYEALILNNLAAGNGEEAFRWAEKARARAFAEGVTAAERDLPIVTIDAVQATLGTDETVVAYYTTGVVEQDIPLMRAIAKDNPVREHLLLPGRIVRFVIGRERFSAELTPLDPNLLTTTAHAGRDGRRFLDRRMWPMLTKSLLADLPDTSRLTILPHGPLHHLPFYLLLSQAGNADTEVGYAPSLTIWQYLRNRQAQQTGQLLAIAYNGDGERAPMLHYAEREAETVAAITGGRVWDESAAQALATAAAAANLLHFSCHGWFEYETPLESYLELGEGWRLTAQTVLDSWQLHARLVTLSACQTGTSRVLRGDEPMGLVRAFLSAGAQAVLVTQWPIADLPTMVLMSRFYELLDSLPPRTALHQAQRWLRQMTRPAVKAWLADHGIRQLVPPDEYPFANPQFWSGFVLIGE